MAAYRRVFMTHVTCRLTAKNRDQLRNPTLGNQVSLWATFTFLRLQKHKPYNFLHCMPVDFAMADLRARRTRRYGGLIRRYIYQLDVDVVGGRSAVEAHHDGVRLSTAEAERYLVASRVRPRCLRVREGQQTPGPTVATVAETISDTLCRQQLETHELRYDTNHLSNFYIVNLENFARASRRYTGDNRDIHNSTVVGLFMTHLRQ